MGSNKKCFGRAIPGNTLYRTVFETITTRWAHGYCTARWVVAEHFKQPHPVLDSFPGQSAWSSIYTSRGLCALRYRYQNIAALASKIASNRKPSLYGSNPKDRL